MRRPGNDLLRAAPLALLLGALACGPGGSGGCGPALDADKIAADAKKGSGSKQSAAARASAADAVIATGKGYNPGGYSDSLSGFSSTEGGLPGSPKSEFARLAQSLPPTPENQKLITQAMGSDAARGGQGGSTDLAGNGGYVTVGKSGDGRPVWQWNAYDAKHAAPRGFEKPYVPSGSAPAADPSSAAPTANADPSLQAPPGYNGCWPKPPGLSRIKLDLMGGNGNRRVVDSTPIVCSANYCSAVGFVGRGCCPARPEGDPMRVKCEGELLGRNSAGQIGPRWTYKGNGGVETHPANPFLAFGYGVGWVGACSNISPVCNWIYVDNSKTDGAGAGGGGASGPPATTPPAPKPTPLPTPAPSTGTAPAPVSGSCLLPMGPDNFLLMEVGEQTTAVGRALNLTPKWCGDPADMPPAGYRGRCGTKCCILGVDGGEMGLGCERALVGTPQWTGTEPFAENPFLAHPAVGAKVCSQIHPQFCSIPTQ